MKRRTLATLAAAALLLLGVSAAPAFASDPVQTKIEAIIAQYGGEQISTNQIGWDDGDVVLTVPAAFSTQSVGSCATGKFCAYSAINQAGLSISFTNCTTANSTAPIGSVRSVANARTSGSVKAYNGATVVLTVGAGAKTNTGATITRLGC